MYDLTVKLANFVRFKRRIVRNGTILLEKSAKTYDLTPESRQNRTI